MDKINNFIITRDVSKFDGLFPNGVNAGSGSFADGILMMRKRAILSLFSNRHKN
jgi:hypothetical protein